MPSSYKRHFGPRPLIRGRRRFFDPERKVEFCERVAAGASVEEAAEAMDVSSRTVERERKFDEDFDHEVRLALQSTPEPEKLLQGHARKHWRAAAWLLERSDPVRFGRRPSISATPGQLDTALRMMIEAALAVTPPEFRRDMYRHLDAASEYAFKWVFPDSPWDIREKRKQPQTPLTREVLLNMPSDPRNQIQVFEDETGNIVTHMPQWSNAKGDAKASTITSAPAALLTAKGPEAKEPVAPARESNSVEPVAPARANKSPSAPILILLLLLLAFPRQATAYLPKPQAIIMSPKRANHDKTQTNSRQRPVRSRQTPLPTQHPPLPTAHCQLPTAYCQLPPSTPPPAAPPPAPS